MKSKLIYSHSNLNLIIDFVCEQIIVLSVAFYILSFTADEHLSPSLQQISKTFRLSESLAGVTLLAFGGGAPDVFASLSSTTNAGGEVGMGISVLLGASLFILSIVGAGVIYFAPQTVQLNKSFFIRDILFLIVSLLVLFYAITIEGSIDLNMSILFIALYFFYVLIVFYLDQITEKQNSNLELNKRAAREFDSLQSNAASDSEKSLINN